MHLTSPRIKTTVTLGLRRNQVNHYHISLFAIEELHPGKSVYDQRSHVMDGGNKGERQNLLTTVIHIFF